jgi:hypothetical protein
MTRSGVRFPSAPPSFFHQETASLWQAFAQAIAKRALSVPSLISRHSGSARRLRRAHKKEAPRYAGTPQNFKPVCRNQVRLALRNSSRVPTRFQRLRNTFCLEKAQKQPDLKGGPAKRSITHCRLQNQILILRKTGRSRSAQIHALGT